MRRPSLRRLIVSVVLTLPVAACASEPVSPLPVDAQAPSTQPAPPVTKSPTTGATTQRLPVRGPTAAPSPVATPSPACLGAVVHTLNAETDLNFATSICLAVGGILRVENTGPGTVSADPQEKVSEFYEAGVVECRFLSPGTVTISIERDQQTFTIPVVVR